MMRGTFGAIAAAALLVSRGATEILYAGVNSGRRYGGLDGDEPQGDEQECC